MKSRSVVENTDVTVVEQLDTPSLVQEEAVSAVEEAASLLSIVEETFLEEAEEILATTEWLTRNSGLNNVVTVVCYYNCNVLRHSLKGGARMAENEPVGAIAYELETTFRTICCTSISVQTCMTHYCKPHLNG